MQEMKPFFGEIHTHTGLSDGNGSAEDNFRVASAHLDFWAMADHAFDKEVFDLDYRKSGPNGQILNDHWQTIQSLCRDYEDPGRFIPFLAYEWTNYQYGHHNVYYLEYDQPLRMPPTLRQLYKAVNGVDVLVIPHHTGYAVGFCGKNWDYHDERLSPFVEIYSMHGSSEEPGGPKPLLTGGSWMGPGGAGGSVQEGLARGYRLGIMASSDSHFDHPGAYDNGLIAAYADDLSRRSLWDAFKRKSIYGVTGDRIILDFRINGEPMGSSITARKERRIDIKVEAWDAVDRVDIIKNNTLLHSFVAPVGSISKSSLSRVRFMVEWGWDRMKHEEWTGRLQVKGGRIVEAVECRRGDVESRLGRGITAITRDSCAWTSKPRQVRVGWLARTFAEGIAFDVECAQDGEIGVQFDYAGMRREEILNPRDIMGGPKVVYVEHVPPVNNGAYWDHMASFAKYKIHQGHPVAALTLDLEYSDAPSGRAGTDFYYVRVVQKNGQLAWSSPIWVDGQ